MKKYIIVSFLLVLFSCNCASAEEIRKFDFRAVIQEDSSVLVTETIDYNPYPLDRHGIYRTIPMESRYRYQVLAVTDLHGEEYQYEESKSGGYLNLKIGDPDVTFTEPRTYLIKYKIENSINRFEQTDEFYWDIIGGEWDIPVQLATVSISLPDGVMNTGQIGTSCYTGNYSSTHNACTEEKVDPSLVKFQTTESLYAGAYFTIAVAWPKELIALPTGGQRLLWYLADYWVIFVPFILFPILLIIWFFKGKDPRPKKSVIPIYQSPKKLSPTESVALLKGKLLGTKVLAAAIIDLAVHGYLEIFHLKRKNYRFEKKKEYQGADQFTAWVFKQIFSKGEKITSKQINKKLVFKDYSKQIPKIFETLEKKKYYTILPDKGYGLAYLIIGFLVMFIFLLIASFTEAWVYVVSGILIMAEFLLFSKIMPVKSQLGVDVTQQIKGFKWFLKVTESKRASFHNPPTKTPQLFYKLLPFAIAFKVEKKWAKQFEGIITESPTWYHGHMAYFSTSNFVSSVNSSVGSITTAASGGSGVGGGGAGGGGGGGGGGGW